MVNKVCGWAGIILNVDLGTKKVEKQALSPTFARKYLGASGFNSAKLFELVKKDADSLGPENVLIFGVGPLSGTLAPGSSGLTVTAKSPLSDAFGSSHMLGFFAQEVKFAGYDQIIIFGKSDQPLYLWIDDDRVELADASHLWGKTTWETARMIKEELGDPEIKIVCIGEAGENLVRFANIIAPQKRACGKSGLGAVMGSKKLKAVAVRGSKDITIAQPKEFIQVCQEIRENVVHKYFLYNMLHELGTPGLVDRHAPQGAIGVRNYQDNIFPNWEAISGKTLKRDFGTSMRACAACHVACGVHHRIKSGEFGGVQGDGPEFATTGMGLRLGIDNLPGLLKTHELFNQYGIDIISARGVIGWAMECFQRGILTREDFGGSPLSWGDYGAVLEMIPKIARREGFGNILAEGEKRAPLLVGRGSEKYMHHVKGVSLPSEDPRADKLFGFQYVTAPRGADHLTASILHMLHLISDTDVGRKIAKDAAAMNRRVPDRKGMIVKWCEDVSAVVNASGICIRTGGSIHFMARALSSATGVVFSVEELFEIGERIFNVQKAFNARLGLTRKDDNFSNEDKFTREPIKDGLHKGQVLEIEKMLDEYYQAREWDEQTGLQSRKKLENLGLEDVAEELEKVNALR